MSQIEYVSLINNVIMQLLLVSYYTEFDDHKNHSESPNVCHMPHPLISFP